MSTPSNLTSNRQLTTCTGESTTGYSLGGFSPGPTFISTMDKTTYSTDGTTSVHLVQNWLGSLYSVGAAGSPSTGYFMGGYITGFADCINI